MSTKKGNEIVLIDSDSDGGQAQLFPAAKKQKIDDHRNTTNSFKKPFMTSSSSLVVSSDNDVEIEPSNTQDNLESDTPDSESLDSGDDLDQISLTGVSEISPQTIIETRKYLKIHGTMKFLEKYLPTTASSEDLIQLIVQLGYIPRNLPEPTSSNLSEMINFLHQAMKNVRSIRSRLDDFYKIGHFIEAISKAQKILVITGAGISTSLGIPDFRSSKGFYSKVQHLGLSDPQEVFDLELFHTDPSLFYSIAYMILPPDEIFSPLHAFIKLLQDKGKLLRNYTQNIDNLESHVGIDPERLIQCHGSFATATCVTCNYQTEGEQIFPEIREREIPYCPKCSKARKKILGNEDVYIPESYGVMKPDVTFFGEPLPRRFHKMIREDLSQCDLLISIGTSLKVAPVADIVEKIPEHVPQILINKDPIEHCNFDVSLLGYCDEVASYLCNKLGKSWDIPHEDYDRIRGENGSNLDMRILDEEQRLYQIINKEKTIQRTSEQEQEQEPESSSSPETQLQKFHKQT